MFESHNPASQQPTGTLAWRWTKLTAPALVAAGVTICCLLLTVVLTVILLTTAYSPIGALLLIGVIAMGWMTMVSLILTLVLACIIAVMRIMQYCHRLRDAPSASPKHEINQQDTGTSP